LMLSQFHGVRFAGTFSLASSNRRDLLTAIRFPSNDACQPRSTNAEK
jgi:hypothetical protein